MTTQEQVEDTTKWPPHVEKILIDILVEEVNKEVIRSYSITGTHLCGML
jgi:hypothetical protein